MIYQNQFIITTLICQSAAPEGSFCSPPRPFKILDMKCKAFWAASWPFLWPSSHKPLFSTPWARQQSPSAPVMEGVLAKNSQSGCCISNQLFIRGDQSHAKKRSKEVSVRRKKIPPVFRMGNYNHLSWLPCLCWSRSQPGFAVSSFANLLSITGSKELYLWPQPLPTYPLLSFLWFHYECL